MFVLVEPFILNFYFPPQCIRNFKLPGACKFYFLVQIVYHKYRKRNGIRGVANSWFSSYIQNRLQYVSINGLNSNWEHTHYGVPQGSILGQQLILIYNNNLNFGV